MTDVKKGSASDTGWYGRLDREVILDAALALAARPGASDIRFRELGIELGADPTAVYRHFRGKKQLMAAVIDRLMTEIADGLPDTADWHAVIDAAAAAVFDTFMRYPAVGMRLGDSRPVGPGELAVTEVGLRALEGAGLSGTALVEYYGALSGFLLSFVATACREAVTAESSGNDAVDHLPWMQHEVELTPENFPTLSRHAAELDTLQFRATYAAGLRVLIAAIGAAGGRQSASSSL